MIPGPWTTLGRPTAPGPARSSTGAGWLFAALLLCVVPVVLGAQEAGPADTASAEAALAGAIEGYRAELEQLNGP